MPALSKGQKKKAKIRRKLARQLEEKKEKLASHIASRVDGDNLSITEQMQVIIDNVHNTMSFEDLHHASCVEMMKAEYEEENDVVVEELDVDDDNKPIYKTLDIEHTPMYIKAREICEELLISKYKNNCSGINNAWNEATNIVTKDMSAVAKMEFEVEKYHNIYQAAMIRFRRRVVMAKFTFQALDKDHDTWGCANGEKKNEIRIILVRLAIDYTYMRNIKLMIQYFLTVITIADERELNDSEKERAVKDCAEKFYPPMMSAARNMDEAYQEGISLNTYSESEYMIAMDGFKHHLEMFEGVRKGTHHMDLERFPGERPTMNW